MKREWTKIELKKERPFNKRMGATLLFMRENLATILRLSASFLLPTVLLFTFFFTWSTSHLFRLLTVGYITPSALGAFALLLASTILLILLVPALSYSLLQLYNERDERLKGIHFGEVMSQLKGNFTKIACILPYLIILISLFILLKIKTSSIVAIIASIVFLLGIGAPLLLLMPIYTIEKSSLFKSFKRSLSLGYRHWGSTLLFWFVLKLLGACILLFFAFPWIMSIYVEAAFFASSTTFEVPFIYQIIIYLFSLLMVFGLVFSSIFILIGMAYQYAHTTLYRKKIYIVDDIDKAEESFKVLRDK